jgi:hypothetical protein
MLAENFGKPNQGSILIDGEASQKGLQIEQMHYSQISDQNPDRTEEDWKDSSISAPPVSYSSPRAMS